MRDPVRPNEQSRGSRRGSPHLRLKVGFLLMAIVLSFFAARLVQLQGFDPHSYAQAAEKENLHTQVLPAQRGRILDRNGEPLADSADGLMITAAPSITAEKAPELATLLATKLDLDYSTVLAALTGRSRGSTALFAYVARKVPAAKATEAVDDARAQGFKGLYLDDDPIREYPAGDVAANIVGFLGTDGPLAGLEKSLNGELAGKDGKTTYEVASQGTRIPLGDSTTVEPVNGTDVRTTIDGELQYYAQRVLRQADEQWDALNGMAVVQDVKTGEILALADDPTFDASNPGASPKADRGARSLSEVYEPGSVEKVLTLSSLIDAGKVTDRTQLVVPGELHRQDRVIHDWFSHGTLHLTLAGVVAQSSNIGTVLAADKFGNGQLRQYLDRFGLGRRTNVGLAGESPGILPSTAQWNHQIQDRVDFGQSVSVNALQMASAVNTVANGGVRIDPSLILGHATTDSGQVVGTDEATSRRVVSEQAATQMMKMMERVPDPRTGVAPQTQIAGYRVAGKTGTAQRAVDGRYDGSLTVSYAGFAPADNPRFTVYVVINDPRAGHAGGGSTAGPVWQKIMSFALRRYGVAPTGAKASDLPTMWGKGVDPHGRP
ncbi:peptidoglycan D,D-transpeptidase FtsI family protein [Nocardioides nematodiphilus]|uniref:peptidoglycan D,D-transpeptidase FtsI family protein n=1 Tax=Nocardioides nematodiphilus TaxID=2849669 RepID=UPI001CDA2CAE|nr:penicillin-binding protein 2 [Nocardioides nematodiphilus]MCA1982486.1 penicillin-binding protein 2 [Nocardioides nematodiphilus]